MVANYNHLDEMTGMVTAMESEIGHEEDTAGDEVLVISSGFDMVYQLDWEMKMEGGDEVSALSGYASNFTSMYGGEDVVAMDEESGNEQTEDVQERLVPTVLDDSLEDLGELACDNVLTSPGQMAPMQNSDEGTSSLPGTGDSMNMGNAATVQLHIRQPSRGVTTPAGAR